MNYIPEATEESADNIANDMGKRIDVDTVANNMEKYIDRVTKRALVLIVIFSILSFFVGFTVASKGCVKNQQEIK